MKALLVYESMFGNTRTIAEAIARGLGAHMEVELTEVGMAPRTIPADVDLLVIGGPTHAFTMSRPGTRLSAEQMGDEPVISADMGQREWIEQLGDRVRKVPVATFDTRIDKPRWFWGSAARAAQRRFRRLGFPLAARAENFFVKSAAVTALVDGEVERAEAWGQALAESRVHYQPPRRPGTSSRPRPGEL